MKKRVGRPQNTDKAKLVVGAVDVLKMTKYSVAKVIGDTHQNISRVYSLEKKRLRNEIIHRKKFDNKKKMS
jgi:hypothetical protein